MSKTGSGAQGSDGRPGVWRRLARQTVIVLSGEIAHVTLGMAKAAVVARVLTPAGRGVYGLAVSVPLLLANLGDFGLGTSIVMPVARKHYSLGNVIGSVLAFSAAAGTLLAVVAFAACRGLFPAALDSPVLAPYAFPIALLVPLLLASHLGERLLIAKGLLLSRGIATNLSTVLQLALFLAFVGLAGKSVGVTMWSLVAACGAGCLLPYAFLPIADLRRIRTDRRVLAESIRSGLVLWAAQCFEWLILRQDLFLAARYVSTTDLGCYGVAKQLAEMVRMAPAGMLLPFIPMLYGMTERDGRDFTPACVRASLVLLLCLFAFTAAFGWPLIRVVFGNDYSPAYFQLLLLLPGVASWSLYRFLRFDLVGRNKERNIALMALVTAALNVTGNIALVPYWGALGAAAASSLSYTLMLFLAGVSYARASGNTLRNLFAVRREDLLRFATLSRIIVRRAMPGRHEPETTVVLGAPTANRVREREKAAAPGVAVECAPPTCAQHPPHAPGMLPTGTDRMVAQ